jgi:hypothetical protein
MVAGMGGEVLRRPDEVCVAFGATLNEVRRPGLDFTNVSFSQFGEGTFDWSFIIRIPTDFLVPLDSQSELDMNLRPVTRDGGQMLQPEMVLYDELRRTDYGELLDNADALVHP